MAEKVALKLAYIGTRFYGYARQTNVPTVEGMIIKKFVKKQIIDSVKKAQIRCASRTDKHVSALTNVMAFYTDESLENVLYSLMGEFESVYPYGITQVSEDFNPCFALKRSYQYYLPTNKFSAESLRSALLLFVGSIIFQILLELNLIEIQEEQLMKLL